jgi:hypothetical protein
VQRRDLLRSACASAFLAPPAWWLQRASSRQRLSGAARRRPAAAALIPVVLAGTQATERWCCTASTTSWHLSPEMLKLTRQLFDVLSMPLTRGPLTGIWGSWGKASAAGHGLPAALAGQLAEPAAHGARLVAATGEMAWYERPESWAACGYPGHRKSENNKSIANARTRPVPRRPGPWLDHPQRSRLTTT